MNTAPEPSSLDVEALLRHIPAIATLSEPEFASAYSNINAEIEFRVGIAVSAELTDTQLQEFETLLETGGDVIGWLTHHVPNYTQITENIAQATIAETSAAISQIIGLDTTPK